jgi:hypothetical protein
MLFFNLATNKNYNDPLSARLPYNSLPNTNILVNLKRKKPNNAVWALGVRVSVNYTLESTPIHDETNYNDVFRRSDYNGILELDSKNNIIGGDWFTNAHPNFMWMPDINKNVSGVSDGNFTIYDGNPDLLKNIAPYAVEESKKGQILKAFVNYLVEQGSSLITDSSASSTDTNPSSPNPTDTTNTAGTS